MAPASSTGAAGRGEFRGAALAVVPARIGSTRLPRKMLLAETGRCLFEHTVERVHESGAFDRVVLATDSGEIADAAKRAGIDVVMTAASHPSGTDRVHEAAGILAERGDGDYDVIVNVQGDEAELDAEGLRVLVAGFADFQVELATLSAPLALEDLDKPQVVKVVCDGSGDALYFSRAPLASWAAVQDGTGAGEARHHLGVYGFRPPALQLFCSLPPSVLELAERLEQLRWLEAGRRMRVLHAARATRGIDTPEDYRAFVARWKSGAGLPQKHGSARS
jgi:3-deoxy-manno-octulosonate cytidylyltransferase (CMP-KDO synthetase)